MSRPMYVENPAFLELCGMVMVEPTFCHRRYIWISKRRVLVVLLYSGLYRPTGLYDVHLDTLIQSAVYSWRTQSQLVLHRTEEAGELPKRQANYSDVMLMKHSADPTVFRLDIWKKNDRGGLVSRLCGCNLRVEGTSYLYDATTIFPEIGLEELELIMESSLVTQNPESVHRGWKNGVYIGGMVMWPMVQVEVGVCRFSVDVMAHGAIWYLIYIDVEKG